MTDDCARVPSAEGRFAVALVGCRGLPQGEEDMSTLVSRFAAAGFDATWRVWDDPAVDWTAFDLVVVRTPWDYTGRREEFLAWAEGVPRLANPAAVLRWNSDKTYLRELAGAGVDVVPTSWAAPGEQIEVPDGVDVVVKPTVGAGSLGVGRFPGADPATAGRVREHVRALHCAGRVAMVQPYLSGVDTAGETSLVYLGGRYSHAIRKGPMLPPDTVHALSEGTSRRLFVAERITPRAPSSAQRQAADRAVAAVPHGDEMLYARVDLLPGRHGPVLVELELTEPSLFHAHGPGSDRRLAEAVAAHCARTAEGAEAVRAG